MNTHSLSRFLTPHLERLVSSEVSLQPKSPEIFATCGQCRMQQPDIPPADVFSAGVKCCSFTPRLPNFSVGSILNKPDDSEGKVRVLGRIKQKIGVRPDVLMGNPFAEYSRKHRPDAFGKDKRLVCPYFIDKSGTCSIWEDRESVCSTYFCVFVEGEKGREFWRRLLAYLKCVELVVARVCVEQISPELLDGILKRKAPAVDANEDSMHKPPIDSEYNLLWGGFVGREIEYYKSCWELSRSLTAEIVADFGGSFLRQAETRVLELC